MLNATTSQGEGIVQLDILRIAAAAAVVCLHVSAGLVLNPHDTMPEWWAGNIADAPSRWCVPVFVMISGALLLSDRRPSTPMQFYLRRAARLLPPLVFWTVVYLTYSRVSDHTPLAELLKDTVKGSPYYHLWFLYMILGLYAVTPLLKTLIANTDRASLTIAAALLLLIASIDRTTSIATLSARHTKDAPHTFLVLWLPYTAYFLAGYILIKWPLRIGIAVAMICAVISTALITFVVAYAHSKGWQDPYFAYDSFNPLGIFTSLALFACFSNIPISCGPKTRGRIQSLAGLTLGIYLVHPLWLLALQSIGIDAGFHRTFVGIPFTTGTAFVLSALTTAAIRATPILRRVV